jgi:hypothetical protein
MRRLMQVGLVVAVGAGCGLFGGGEGGSGNEGAVDWVNWPAGIYRFFCYNAGPVKNWAGRADGSQYTPDYVNACVYVDPGDPSWEAKAREGCSKNCEAIAWYGKSLCEDANWSSVAPEGNPSDGFVTCKNQTPILPPGAVPPGPNGKGRRLPLKGSETRQG